MTINSNSIHVSEEQIQILQFILEKNDSLFQILKDIEKFNLPNYYVGGGAVTQTVWNYILDKPLNHGISDVDIVYYDSDLSEEKEIKYRESIQKHFETNEFQSDVTNEARVHLWYNEAFGKEIKAYDTVEEAIKSWPTTATSIGVRLINNQLIVYAPYGLEDLFELIVRPNKIMIDKKVYEEKINKWKQKWQELDYLEWE